MGGRNGDREQGKTGNRRSRLGPWTNEPGRLQFPPPRLPVPSEPRSSLLICLEYSEPPCLYITGRLNDSGCLFQWIIHTQVYLTLPPTYSRGYCVVIILMEDAWFLTWRVHFTFVSENQKNSNRWNRTAREMRKRDNFRDKVFIVGSQHFAEFISTFHMAKLDRCYFLKKDKVL